MGKGGFEGPFLAEVTPNLACLKDLACKLRDTLFCEGDIFIGTPEESFALYDAMIRAFDDAIADI